jgi:hypothetical protein
MAAQHKQLAALKIKEPASTRLMLQQQPQHTQQQQQQEEQLLGAQHTD